jgi:signal transduction histidine kinase
MGLRQASPAGTEVPMEGLRRSAWLVGASALVPLLLFLAFETAFSAREQRRAIEDRTLAKSEAVSVAVDGEFRRLEAGMGALATAMSLRAGDLDGFRARANELTGLYEGWRGVELLDMSKGQRLLVTGPESRTLFLTQSGRAKLHPRLIGFARGQGCPCVVFDQIAQGPPGAQLTLRLLVDGRRFQNLLPDAHSGVEVSALVGPNGRFIARSLDPEGKFGQLASPYLVRAVKSGKASGIYRGFTLEGFESYTAFTRSRVTDWSVHLAISSREIDNPARRFLTSIGVAALLALAVAVVLVWFALRQVAEGRRLSERMMQSQKLEALGQLTGGLAHDFNNLLTPIVGTLDVLSKKPDLDARSKRMATGALASAERAGKLTAQLLAFSRRQKLQISPIDVAAMLDEMSDMFRQSVGDSQRIDIRQDDETLCALGDLNQLELAILNLILNARDASEEGSPISVIVTGDGTEQDGTVSIAVQDQGLGMDAATRSRALEPFFTTKGPGGGTGLGLAQVFGMAEQSGGRVDIESEPGHGTTVSIRLRRCSPAAGLQGTVRSAAPTQPPIGLHVLVVDDEPEVRSTIVRTIEEAGHIVDTVSDGPTALAAIAQRRFDVVLIDFVMPGMDGAELIRRARAIRDDTRYLLISGYSDSEAIAAVSPDTPILRKPFDREELVRITQELAAQPRG